MTDATTQAKAARTGVKPPAAITTRAVTAADRSRSLPAAPLALLERLPPFWAAFLLLLLLPLPQAFLATPIAAADAGLLGGIGLLLVVGAVNVLTVGYTAEATARSRSMGGGTASVGRLGADILGRLGSTALSLSVAALFFLALVASDLGLSRTMAEVTGLPIWVWSIALPVAVLALLGRGRRVVSLGVMLMMAALNVGLIVVIAVLALTHVNGDNIGGDLFAVSGLERILGVAMMCFFGQALVPQTARIVLHRDPGGRAFIRGSLAGTACLVLLVAGWTGAVAGALPRSILTGDNGTVIAPLAREVGLGINLLGSVLIVSALGMTALRCAMVLSNLTLERLPRRTGRRWFSLLPALAAFLGATWVEFGTSVSYAATLGFTGVVTVSVFGGLIPPLLLFASRRVGELAIPVRFGWLGRPVVAVAVYVLFFANLVVHGLVIWENDIARAGALIVALAMLAGTVAMLRRHLLNPRLSVKSRAGRHPVAAV